MTKNGGKIHEEMRDWGGGEVQAALCCLNMKFEAGSSQTRLDGWAGGL